MSFIIRDPGGSVSHTMPNVEFLDLEPKFLFQAQLRLAQLSFPQVVSAIVSNDQTIPRWRIVFLSAAAVNTAGNLVYVALGTSREQPWNKPRDIQERLLSQH